METDGRFGNDAAGASPAAKQSLEEINAQLRNRIDDLEAVFRVLAVGIGISTDASCNNISINPALGQMLGLDPKQNASLSAPPGKAPTAFEVWNHEGKLEPGELPMQTAARENREVRNFEEIVVREDGRKLHLTCDAVPLRAPDGTVRGVAATFRDVTDMRNATEERVAIERRLLETQQSESLSVLTAGIAHDFNNMLSIVMSSSELARMDLPDESPLLDFFQTIETTVQRAGNLCQQLLAFSGQGRFVVQETDINTIAQRTLQLLKPTILANNEVAVDLAPGLPVISADAPQIQQLLLNLLTNAAESCGERRGHLSVSTASVEVDQILAASTQPANSLAPGPCVRLRVTDDGAGMTPEVIEKAFAPFFTTKFIGRGLGLSVVLGVVRGHHGALTIESRPGAGTIVDVYLPVATKSEKAKTAHGEADPSEPHPVANQLSGRVLVVDDEEILRRSLSTQLSKLGLSVETAGDGIDALEMMERNGGYDLILLDVTMPRLNGFETLERIREFDEDPRVIIMSGFAPQKIADEFAHLKPDAIISKPFLFPALHQQIVRVLAAGR